MREQKEIQKTLLAPYRAEGVKRNDFISITLFGYAKREMGFLKSGLLQIYINIFTNI